MIREIKKNYQRLLRSSQALFLEGAALVFLGVFQNNLELKHQSEQALHELGELGYQVPDSESVVRIAPMETGQDATTIHAAGWKPGRIFLRDHPQSNNNINQYLRHELMHEAFYRTCKADSAEWVKEAAALSFSGELVGYENEKLEALSTEELSKIIQSKGIEHPQAREALKDLLIRYPWPKKSCDVNQELSQILDPKAAANIGLSWVAIDYISGRIIGKKGDTQTKRGAASLLKLPYVSSLKDAPKSKLGEFLRDSNSQGLLNYKSSFDTDRYIQLISPMSFSEEGIKHVPNAALIGERGADSNYPIQGSLVQIAWMIRLSALNNLSSFQGLSLNGQTPQSTLHNAEDKFKNLLANSDILAKTGTLSSSDGEPEFGYLALIWPKSNPHSIAIFGKEGVRGAGLANLIEEPLSRLVKDRNDFNETIKVKLLSPLPKQAWNYAAYCNDSGATLCQNIPLSGNRTTSPTGAFIIKTSANQARKERIVSGVISDETGSVRMLETSLAQYANQVVEVEGSGLPKQAKTALEAVIAWNAAFGATPHVKEHALCDTTHCMVFLGSSDTKASLLSSEAALPKELIADLTPINAKNPQNVRWFKFSTDSNTEWQKVFRKDLITSRMQIHDLVSIKRERKRTGEISIVIDSSEGLSEFGCEQFALKMDLPSCPNKIVEGSGQSDITFSGVGAGFNSGLSLARAKELALMGKSALEILNDAYGN